MGKRKSAAVSMEPVLYDRAKVRADSLGISTFSAYVVQLIRKDLAARGELILHEDDGYEIPPDLPVTQPEKRQVKKKPD